MPHLFAARAVLELGAGSSHHALRHEAEDCGLGEEGGSEESAVVRSSWPLFKQNTAESVSILTTHLFGDAFSPYLVGVISDTLTSTYNIDSVGRRAGTIIRVHD